MIRHGPYAPSQHPRSGPSLSSLQLARSLPSGLKKTELTQSIPTVTSRCLSGRGLTRLGSLVVVYYCRTYMKAVRGEGSEDSEGERAVS